MYKFTDSERDEVLKTLQKRRNIYSIIFAILLAIGLVGQLIPVVGYYLMIIGIIGADIFAGLAMYCINNYRFQKSNGAKKGGGLLWWVLNILGLIIIPFITIWIVNKNKKLASKVLGCEVND